MRGGRYLVVLAGVSLLAAGCGTTQADNLAAAVTSTAPCRRPAPTLRHVPADGSAYLTAWCMPS